MRNSTCIHQTACLPACLQREHEAVTFVNCFFCVFVVLRIPCERCSSRRRTLGRSFASWLGSSTQGTSSLWRREERKSPLNQVREFVLTFLCFTSLHCHFQHFPTTFFAFLSRWDCPHKKNNNLSHCQYVSVNMSRAWQLSGIKA